MVLDVAVRAYAEEARWAAQDCPGPRRAVDDGAVGCRAVVKLVRPGIDIRPQGRVEEPRFVIGVEEIPDLCERDHGGADRARVRLRYARQRLEVRRDGGLCKVAQAIRVVRVSAG